MSVMIRTNTPAKQMSPSDLEETILYYQKQIVEWQYWKEKTSYFQSFAVENIARLEDKIKVLKAFLPENTTE